jgi:hypothetical protein
MSIIQFLKPFFLFRIFIFADLVDYESERNTQNANAIHIPTSTTDLHQREKHGAMAMSETPAKHART